MVTNTAIFNNSANEGTAVANLYGSDAIFVNVTIASDDNDSNPVLTNLDCSPVFYNSIVWGAVNSTSSSQFYNSMVKGSGGSGGWNTTYGIDNGGNIDADPIFTDLANDDATLTAYSPAINAGATLYFEHASNEEDLKSDPRLFGSAIDMGAYERQDAPALVRYVKQDGTGNGTNWADASGNLQAMINASGTNGTVWVAAGTYQPQDGSSFTLKNGVDIYGGFPATDDPVMDDRNWALNATTLLGNNATVVIATSLTEAPTLDGFTITGGDGTLGGGIMLDNASPLLNNLAIRNNTAQSGGGLYVTDSAILTLKSSLIVDNTAQTGGGAYLDSDTNLINVTLAGTTANDGGGLYFNGVTGGIRSCILWGNTSADNASDNVFGGASTNYLFSLVQGSGGSSNWQSAFGSDWSGNVDSDPLFTDAPAGDYSIMAGSAAVNGGYLPSLPEAAILMDAAGNPRLIGSGLDMGAYELQNDSTIRFVKQGGTGNGTSWAAASGSVMQMVANSSSGHEVWVAKGTYADSTIYLKDNVEVYGGFPADGGTMESRDWRANETILQSNNTNEVISCQSGLTPTSLLDGFTITGSSSSGLQILYGSPTLNNLVVRDNSSNNGGGFNIHDASPLVNNVIIRNNSSTSYGGGIAISGASTPVFKNTLVIDNTTTYHGGGVYINTGTPIFINTTIAGNTGVLGGGLYAAGAAAIMQNSIVAGNTSTDTSSQDVRASSTLTVFNSLIESIDGLTSWNSDFGTDGGNNIVAGAAFTNAAGADYRLQSGSPALNAGNNGFFADAANSPDLSGNMRVFGTIDMGAYENLEISGNIRYVRLGGTGDGTSWDTASGDLQGMMNAAPGTQVWVGAGTYMPDGTTSFVMYPGVKVYGGFPATGYPAMDDRVMLEGGSTLSGSDGSVIKNDSNGLTPFTLLDGFVIAGGEAAYGGGIYNRNVSPTFSNLAFTNNFAYSGGGAIWHEGGSVAFINIALAGNYATEGGGGIHLKDANGIILNTTITDNSSGSEGDAIFFENASPAIMNTIIWNTAAAGVIYKDSNSTPEYFYSIVQGSGGSSAWGTAYGTDGGGNLDADPMIENGFMLLAGSPAQNAGNTSLFTNAVNAKDFIGNDRLSGDSIDMGAFETFEEPLIRYVKTTAAGVADGSSWANASNDLQGMIDASPTNGEVWVAAGIYKRANSGEYFSMKEHVKIYGGFPTTGNPTMANRDWNVNFTELVGHDASVIYNNNNALTAAAVLDGFIVRTGFNAVGGGIYNYNVSPTLTNLKIRQNFAYYGSGNNKGAGIYEELCNSTITNTVINSNVTGGQGGNIYFKDSGSSLINVTITEGFSETSGGGLVLENSNINISNSIIWRNRVSSGASNIELIGTSAPVITNCLIQGSGGSLAWSSEFGIDGGGNIDANPLFVDPGNFEFRLQSLSPAVNQGNAVLLANAETSKDLGAQPRIFDTSIDMGAYESQVFIPQIRYVTVTGAGTQDGTSWANASPDVQAMIDLSKATDRVFVAAGEYQRNDGEYYSIKTGVAVYGGFPATGSPTMEDRDWIANSTTLKGNNSYVVFNDTAVTDAVLDGFTITAGEGELAGAIYAYDSTTEFSNLTITGNECTNGGGGGVTTHLGAPKLHNVILTNNTTAFGGGGIYVHKASTEIKNSLIADNNAAIGGGIFGIEANFSVVNVSITQNTADEGGAIYNYNGSADYYNCIIWDNTTGDGSGDDIMSGYNVFHNCLVEGSGGSNAWTSNHQDNGGNIDIDPMFIDPIADNFDLQAGSPAANTGNKDYHANAITAKDVAGNSRLMSSEIDMGAYESTLNTSIRYVKQDASGNGTTWDDASGGLQAMMEASGPADKVFVAAGTYMREPGYSFEMREGVEVYGGFPSEGDPVMSERNWATNVTTLTAEGVGVIYNSHNGLTPASLLDGFVVTGGSTIYGAGIFNQSTSPTYKNLIIKDNTAYAGGAIYSNNSSAVITNVAIIQNSAEYGAGIAFYNDSSMLTNVTISGNTSPSYGNGILFSEAGCAIRNSILWDKHAVSGENKPAYTYSDIKGSGGSSDWVANYGTNGGNNIDADPFLNPDGTIQAGSPASNTGNNAYFENAATGVDLAGNSRIFDDENDIIDMGAYEEQGGEAILIRYVMEGGTGDGLSWATASGDLQAMINASQATRQVWIAAGTYVPIENESFSMKEGVKVYGGFPPTGAPVLTDRNWAGHATTLSGNGNSVVKNHDNELTNAALLDGFIIQNGTTADNGAGISNINAYPTIANCIVRNNNAGTWGGGIFNSSNSETPGGTKVINSLFYGNTSNGGGAAFDYAYATPEYVNVTFANNTSYGNAGGIHNYEYAQTSLKNCIVWGNIAYGGAYEINSEYESSVTASHCILPDNNLNYNLGGPSTFENVVATDPMYADAANNDFNVLFGSPAINGADEEYFADAEATSDIAGDPRLYDGLLDIGAFESQTVSPKIYYVKVDAQDRKPA